MELPHKPRRDERFVVRVDDFDDRGDGVGRFDALIGPQKLPMSFTVHVRRGVPGDEAEVQVGAAHRRRVDTAITDLRVPSPMRITPRCQHFPANEHPGCGGCSFQSIDFRHQLAVKERRLKRLMSRVKIDPGLVEVVTATSDNGWFYRNKMEFSFAGNGDELACGMHPGGWRYEVIDQRECFLMSEFVATLPRLVRDWCAARGLDAYRGISEEGWLRTLTVREGKRTGERMVELMTAHDDGSAERGRAAEATARFGDFVQSEFGDEVTSVYWTEQRTVRGERTTTTEHLLGGRATLREELHIGARRLSFEIHPRAFFQTNTLGAEILYGMVIEGAALQGDEVALDLYCGTGTIALCLAPFVKQVVGIELQPDAVDNARENAAANDLHNTAFHAGDVGAVLAEQQLSADVIVVDPPRKGLLRSAFEQLRTIDAGRMVYVSCNPEALAGDLVELGRDGWAIQRIRPVDMFPQTAHVEAVVELTRR